MNAEAGIILGIGVALVAFILVRRSDAKRHQQKLDAIQRRIERSEQAARDRRDQGTVEEDR